MIFRISSLIKAIDFSCLFKVHLASIEINKLICFTSILNHVRIKKRSDTCFVHVIKRFHFIQVAFSSLPFYAAGTYSLILF